MKLTTERILRGVATALKEQVAPALQDGFAQEANRMAQALLTICANAVDGAAAIRVEEHARLRALFAEAGPAVAEESLRRRLVEAANSRDPGLRISQLDIETARLRTLLVELHTHVETQPSETARQLDHRIWRLLAEIETLRAPQG